MRSQAKIAGIRSQFLCQCHWCAEKIKFPFNYNTGFGAQINDVGCATCKANLVQVLTFKGLPSSPGATLSYRYIHN